MSSTISVGALEEGPTGQLDVFQSPAPFKCKLPRCNNSCYKEVSGRVHDFCSKAHAIAYMKLQNQHVPAAIMQSASEPAEPLSFKPQILEGVLAQQYQLTSQHVNIHVSIASKSIQGPMTVGKVTHYNTGPVCIFLSDCCL